MYCLLRLWVYGLVILVSASAQAQGVLEIPGNGGKLSGLGLISGWKCNAGTLTVSLDGGEPIPLTAGQRRDDTRSVCGTTHTGFHAPINWALLGDGQHTAVVYDDGVEFARSTFEVATTGEEFVTGASAWVRAPDFPAPGETTRFEWNESTQHLEMVRTPEGEELVESVQHLVIVWLKEPASAEARQKVIATSYGFAEIPGVLRVSAGPSLASARDVVDSSYDVGVVITVRDQAALNAYLEHPKHKQAVQEVLGPLAQKIIVYDFVVSAPK
ncbi:MAG: Dabb family protein [Desulfurellaceae bacterium]|nr:Dabb family protein [Desulfurellaceae bacterium]